MSDTQNIQELFFIGARTVIEAIADPAVEEAWDWPSVLEEQLVGSVAGHLARSGIWVVADYLEAGTPSGEPDFESASAYFAAVAVGASPEVKRAIRDRGVAWPLSEEQRCCTVATRTWPSSKPNWGHFPPVI